MKVRLDAIEMDASIQCRAAIDTGVVNDYAEAMSNGDAFPPVDLFGDKDKAWIGDGWHRVLAAKQLGETTIDANLKPGGRTDALKHALHANATNGLHRTKVDIARCIAIANREFPRLSQHQLAELVGCNQGYLNEVIDTNHLPRPEKVVGKDGKEYPARRARVAPEESDKSASRKEQDGRETAVHDAGVPLPQNSKKAVKVGPPADGMGHARLAVEHLEEIRPDDVERLEAFSLVRGWLDAHEHNA